MAWHPFRNLGVKALSVVLASILWASVSRDQVVERSIQVPIEFQNIPAGLEIVSDTPADADVRVRGTSNMLGRLQPGDVVAVLDLRGARPGERLFHLLADEVRTPFGISVTQVSPPTVSLLLEMSGRKVVPVVPDVVGTPADGHVQGALGVEPATVEVVGPVSRLARLDAATTEAVSIEGARTTVKDEVNIGVQDNALRLERPRAALVTVQIQPSPIERTISDVAVEFRNLAAGRTARIEPDTVAVTVSGPREIVSALTRDDLEPYVDLSNLGPGRYTLPVEAGTSREVSLVRSEPDRVTVRVR